jgi:hypothetical protein
VRHDHRTGTSQASASSSKLLNVEFQRTSKLLRAKEMLGPVPGAPAGACGDRCEDAAMPGVLGGCDPKNSV